MIFFPLVCREPDASGKLMWGLGERGTKIIADDEAILYTEYMATWSVGEYVWGKFHVHKKNCFYVEESCNFFFPPENGNNGVEALSARRGTCTSTST